MAGNTRMPITADWAAIATGVCGLLALAFLILFFALGGPFGTLNDVFNGVVAVMSFVLACTLFSWHNAQAPLLSKTALIAALAGALVAVTGSVLVIAGVTGWFLAGLYTSTGYALIGLWLLGLNTTAAQFQPWSHNLAIFGLVAGGIMAIGLVTIPGITGAIDQPEAASWVNYLGLANAAGWLMLYPVWCVLLGRFLLSR